MRKRIYSLSILHAALLHCSPLKKVYLHLLSFVTFNLEEGGTQGRPHDAALEHRLATISSLLGQLLPLSECQRTIRILFSYLKGCYEQK